MNNSLLVRGCQTARDLPRVFDRFALRKSRAGHALTKRFAFQEFRDDVGGAVMFADVINCEDIRMVQSSCGTGFLLEAMQPLLIVGKCRRQHFDSDITAETSISSAINFAHPARAERRDDFVRT